MKNRDILPNLEDFERRGRIDKIVPYIYAAGEVRAIGGARALELLRNQSDADLDVEWSSDGAVNIPVPTETPPLEETELETATPQEIAHPSSDGPGPDTTPITREDIEPAAVEGEVVTLTKDDIQEIDVGELIDKEPAAEAETEPVADATPETGDGEPAK